MASKADVHASEPAVIRQAAANDRQVKLHPLVLINISDHVTREAQRKPGSPLYTTSERVVGVLFGVQEGNSVDVFESFEMLYTGEDTGVVQFDQEFLQRKMAQCECFPAPSLRVVVVGLLLLAPAGAAAIRPGRVRPRR